MFLNQFNSVYRIKKYIYIILKRDVLKRIAMKNNWDHGYSIIELKFLNHRFLI